MPFYLSHEFMDKTLILFIMKFLRNRKSMLFQLVIIFSCTLFIATSCTNDTSDSENDFEVLNPDNEEASNTHESAE